MTNGEMTIEDLARITQKGFEDTKSDIGRLDERINELEYEMNKRFDQLEKIIFSEYKNRIEKLEDRVSQLESDYRELLTVKTN